MSSLTSALAALCVILAALILSVAAVKGFTITKTLRIVWLGWLDALHGRWPTGRSR